MITYIIFVVTFVVAVELLLRFLRIFFVSSSFAAASVADGM